MKHNRLATPNANGNKLSSRARKAVAITAIASTLAGGLAACGSSETSPATSGTKTEAVSPSRAGEARLKAQLDAVEREAKANLQKHAKEAALTVVSILGDPRSGSEGYKRYYVGNKAATVGPDGRYPTADDAEYRRFPESYAQYNPETDRILISATDEHNAAASNSSHPWRSHFWIFEGVFQLGANNSLAGKEGQLTAADFQTALEDDSTSLVAVNAAAHWNAESKNHVSLWMSPEGFIEDQYDMLIYPALNDRIPGPNHQPLTDAKTIVGQANRVGAIIDQATHMFNQDVSRVAG